MKKMYLRRNGKRMAAFVANGQPDPRDFPARVCGHRIHGSGEIIPRKEGARPTAICRLRLAHERVIIPAVGFPNSEGDAGIYLGSETDHQRFWIRGEERTSNDNRLRFLFQIPNEQGSPTDRLFQEYARVYIGVGTPLPARR